MSRIPNNAMPHAWAEDSEHAKELRRARGEETEGPSWLTMAAVAGVAYLGFKLWSWLATSAPTNEPPTVDVMFWLGLLATLCGGLGLVVLLIACARSELLVGGVRALWAKLTIGAFALYAAADVLLGSSVLRDHPDDFAPADLLPLLYALTMLGCAVGLVIHARRIEGGPPQAAWARAADGLDRYRDATALRVLQAVCLVVFLSLARMSGYSPTVTFGGIAALSLVGLILGLVQIAGLVRVADAPGPRPALGIAVPLIGLGIAAECASLAPIAAYAFNGGEQRMLLRAIDLASVGGSAQGLGLLAMIVLLLALRGLAREREAPRVVARCHAMIAVLVLVIAGVTTLMSVARDLGRDATVLLLLGAGVTLMITAIWLLVVYFRLLAELRDAMLRVDPAN